MKSFASLEHEPIKTSKHLWLRARIFQTIRTFFRDRGYLEVETPCRLSEHAPETHIEVFETEDRCLRPSPELCMKRLLAQGFERIFQICKCFRKDERGNFHLPEFTMLEWYRAGIDYHALMDECEQLIKNVASTRADADFVHYQGNHVNLAGAWPRLTVNEAFERWASLSLAEALRNDCFEETLALELEPHLGFEQPLFLYDYPSAHASLARLKPLDPSVAERFELYIAGIELCNGFSELTDPVEQRKRFEKEGETRQREGKPIYPMPEKFLNALGNMPDAAGNALGLDRLVMLWADVDSIDAVTAFADDEGD